MSFETTYELEQDITSIFEEDGIYDDISSDLQYDDILYAVQED
ncbi:hypothetical protein [Vibrio phage vB_pir03]|nr:hypothetical protein [Vibrio phage vB_pir03]